MTPFPRLLPLVLMAGTAGCGTFRAPEWAPVRQVQVGGSETTAADGYYADASAAIGARDYGRALDLLQMARRGHERDARILNAFGVVYDKLGRFDLSARYYAEALAIEPGSAIVTQNLAYSQQLQQHWIAESGGPGTIQVAERPARPDPVLAAAETAPPAVAVSSTPAPAGATTPEADRATAPLAASNPHGGGAVLLTAAWASPTAVVASVTPPSPAAAAAPRPYALAFKAEISGLLSTAVETIARPKPKPAPRAGWLVLLDASGQAARVRSLRARLSQLGWSAGGSISRVAPVAPGSVIRFPAWRSRVAQALARTLPGPVRLETCGRACTGIQVLFGADVRRWRIAPDAKKRNGWEG